MAIKKPQSPMRFEDTDERFYPLTDETQVVMEDGTRLNHVIKEFRRAVADLEARIAVLENK